jgi:S1-C subfamily serine protease
MRTALSAIIVAAIAAASPVLAKQADNHKSAAAPAARSGQVTPPRAQNKTTAKSENEKEVAILAALERGSAVTPASFPDSVGWRLIEDPATGARLGMPQKLVPRVSASRMGGRWSSAQGQIQVETFRFTEAALPALFEDEKKAARRQIEASVLKPDLFVISGAQGLKNFLMRAEARGGEVRGVTVLYDQATEGTMERIALAMVGSYSAFPDPGAPPPPGLRRAVEYGSAIVVTRDGDLITSARLTDDCRSITVPGIGHAERIAADSATDLALVRVYGARNLVPAVLAGESSPTGDLRLVGVDDPLAQKGEGAAISVRANTTGSDIDPAPARGFAGAAAVDARGALAGMIDFKPANVAVSGDSAHETAKRIPVDAIRAFLKAHDVSPATVADASAGAEQSVLRVICVRK